MYLNLLLYIYCLIKLFLGFINTIADFLANIFQRKNFIYFYMKIINALQINAILFEAL